MNDLSRLERLARDGDYAAKRAAVRERIRAGSISVSHVIAMAPSRWTGERFDDGSWKVIDRQGYLSPMVLKSGHDLRT